MIGQVKLHKRVNKLLYKTNNFPRFVIFIGPRGSGKKTFIKENFKGIYLEDNKIDSVRKLIQLVYKVSNETFIMPDADTMSTAARNALLKIVEECPNNNYFIMTLEDINNTLDTIKSRATIFYMDRYTPDEIFEYYRKRFCLSDVTIELERKEISIVRDLCETPGDVEIIMGHDTTQFYDYVQLVVDNMAEVSLANAFKISSKIALKDDTGYDLRLFWKSFQSICLDKSNESSNKNDTCEYCFWSMITSKYLQQLKNKGVNKQMLFDNWILEIRA